MAEREQKEKHQISWSSASANQSGGLDLEILSSELWLAAIRVALSSNLEREFETLTSSECEDGHFKERPCTQLLLDRTASGVAGEIEGKIPNLLLFASEQLPPLPTSSETEIQLDLRNFCHFLSC